MLRHWRWHLVQSSAGTTLDSPQRHRPIHSSSSNEIRWWSWKSENIDCRKASVQRSWELFYWFPPFLGFSWDWWESTPRRTRLWQRSWCRSRRSECFWKINPLVTSIDKFDFDTTANVENDWFINEDLDLAYLFAFVFDSTPLDTSTDMDNDLWSAMNALTSLRTPIKSSLLVHEKIGGAHNALFKIPAKRKG